MTNGYVEYKFKIEIEGVDGALYYSVPNDGQTEQEAIKQVDNIFETVVKDSLHFTIISHNVIGLDMIPMEKQVYF